MLRGAGQAAVLRAARRPGSRRSDSIPHLVERAPDPEDRRGVIITLTEAGHELIDRVTEAHMANEARLLAGLSAREREQLAGLLRKLGLSLPPLP